MRTEPANSRMRITRDKNLIKNLFFSIVPQLCLVALLVGIALIILETGLSDLGYVAIDIALFYILIRLSIITHEMGHWIGARLVGEMPRQMVLGVGFKILRTHFYTTKLTIYNRITTGYVLTVFRNRKNYRIRRFVYTLMGPVFNLLLALAFVLAFPLTLDIGNKINIAFFGAIFNVILFFGNLYPKKVKINGIEYDSDGLHIWKLLTAKHADVEENDQLISKLLDAQDALEDKSYETALALYKSCLEELGQEISRTRHVAMLNAGICKGQLGDIEGFYELTKAVEVELGEEASSSIAGPLYNNLALTYLLKNDLKNAYHYIIIAIKYAAEMKNVKITKGAIVIEDGDYEAGIKILKPEVNLSYSDNLTIFAAMYLVLAYGSLGKEELKFKYQQFVTDHESSLDTLEKNIWQNIKERCAKD